MSLFAGLLALSALGALPAQAQTAPDAGRVLQETRQRDAAVAAPAPALAPIKAPEATRAAPGNSDTKVQVSSFSFSGNKALSAEVLRAATARWAGRALSFGELVTVVEAVEARYREQGYFLAQAYLAPQKIRDGVVEISVSEGQLGETRLEGESRIASDVIYGYLDAMPKGQALTLTALERQVLLINDLSGGRARLDLQAGDAGGSTDVVLVQEADSAVTARVELNNHGLASTGKRRLGLTLNANSPFHRGESLSLSALTSERGGLNSYNLRGELPLGSDGWRVSLTASRAEYTLGANFAALQASGSADSLRLGVSYPFVRSRLANLKLQLEADQSKLTDRFDATSTVLDKKASGLTATLSGDWTDTLGGGGNTRTELALRTARLSLGSTAAAQDAPPAGPGTAGSFSKGTLLLSRQQTLNTRWTLQAQLNTQWTAKNLDSSEKFSLGGPSSMPGYAGGEVSADSGTQARLGLRWQARPELGLTAFVDRATATLAHAPLPAVTKNTKKLADSGFSADWVFRKQFTATAIVAWAGSEAPNPADNARPRVWLSLGYAW